MKNKKYASRLAKLRETMARSGLDLVALGPSSHMRWLTGVDPHGDERAVLILVSAQGAAFLMPELNAEAARKDTELPFFAWSDGDGASGALDAALSSLIDRRSDVSIALDETMRTDFAYLLTDKFENPRITFTESNVAALRKQKDADEIVALRRSAQINDAAVMAGFDALREGVTEAEIVDVVYGEMKKQGAQPGFCLVAFGANAAMPHHHSGGTQLEANTPVLIDAGCWWEGYPSDMTRTGVFGEAAADFLAAFDAVEAAVRAAMTAFRPGIAGREMDGAARSSLDRAGHGQAFIHRLGHGMGLDIHEPPYLTSTSSDRLEEGSVFSIEPGVYYPDRFGIRLEDIVHVQDGNLHILSSLNRSLIQRG